jgi:manganese/zinc/iron transport system permease protein
MPAILFSTIPLAFIYSFGGFFLARWLDCSIAASMVVIAMFCFGLAWLFGPVDGVIPKLLYRKVSD